MSKPFTLYHQPCCASCARVRRAAAEWGIQLKLIDVEQDIWAREVLSAAVGCETAPVLRVPGRDGDSLLADADEILDYLERWSALNQWAA